MYRPPQRASSLLEPSWSQGNTTTSYHLLLPGFPGVISRQETLLDQRAAGQQLDEKPRDLDPRCRSRLGNVDGHKSGAVLTIEVAHAFLRIARDGRPLAPSVRGCAGAGTNAMRSPWRGAA